MDARWLGDSAVASSMLVPSLSRMFSRRYLATMRRSTGLPWSMGRSFFSTTRSRDSRVGMASILMPGR
jgi:hypothetical protein